MCIQDRNIAQCVGEPDQRAVLGHLHGCQTGAGQAGVERGGGFVCIEIEDAELRSDVPIQFRPIRRGKNWLGGPG
jgi:hypothetical protein